MSALNAASLEVDSEISSIHQQLSMKNSSTLVKLQKKESKAEVSTARMQNQYKLAEDSAISSICQLSAKSSPATLKLQKREP